MADRLKGLTIEIDGDVTKLNKALASVNSTGRNLSQELRSIDKLLQLDPTNTELLAQKQKVLADAIANTEEKLDKLKDAEKQAQEQFKRGEASEEQIRALQREIVATEQQLLKYKQAVKGAADEVKELGDESEEASDETSKFGSNLASVASGAAKAMGAAVAAIGAALIAAAESTREYRAEMGKLETAFTTAGFTAEEGYEAYAELQSILGETDQAVEAANHLAKLTDTQEELSQWTDICTGVYATFGASLPIEGLTEAANETAKVGTVTGSLADALNWAGVSEDEFNESLAACSSEQERQKLITETLNGLYSEAAEKYREVNAAVIDANKANEQWTNSLAVMGASIEPVLTSIKALGATLLSDLAPSVASIGDALSGIISGQDGSSEQLAQSITGLVDSLLASIEAALPVIADVGVSIVGTLLSSILSALPDMLTGLAEVVNQFIVGVGEILPDLLTQLIETACELLISLLTDGLPTLLDTILELVIELIDSVLNDVLPQLISSLPAVIEALCAFLVESIPQILNAATTLLLSIVDALPILIESLVAAMPQIINTMVDSLITGVPMILEAAVALLFAIIDALPVLIETLVTAVPQIVTTIGSTLVSRLPELINTAVQLLLGIVQAIPQFLPKLVSAIPQICSTILNGLTSGLSSIGSIGKDLIMGLWNGISDMASWIYEKIQGFGQNILKSLKSFFGISSPSKVMRDEVGRWLPKGLAKGIEEEAQKPVEAIESMEEAMLQAAEMDGLTIERRMNHSFTTSTLTESAALSTKLDAILEAVKAGQLLTIDGKTFVGATASLYDSALGQRLAFAQRGVL